MTAIYWIGIGLFQAIQTKNIKKKTNKRFISRFFKFRIIYFDLIEMFFKKKQKKIVPLELVSLTHK